MAEVDGAGTVEVSVEDPDDLDALYAELRGVAGIMVQAVPAPAEPGDQGSLLDQLLVACSTGAGAAFVEVIKALFESRGPGFRLKIRRGRDRLEITADNAEEALPKLRDLLDGS